jgi:aminopeptidase 2
VILLSEAGYAPTSSALELMKQMDAEPEHLVWVEIAQAFQRLIDAWWEQPEEIIDGIRAFARSLFGPLVEKVGFSHQPEEDAEARQFRVLAIAAAAAAEDPS